MRTIIRQVVCIAISAVAMIGSASSAGLRPGHHSAQPKYWRVLDRDLTNYTPFEFDYGSGNLTPTADGGLWFSVGESLERIDAYGRMSQFVMPHYLWRVSGIVQSGTDLWFSAGQSGKVGKVDAHGRLRFIQAVPRKFFPDIRDLLVNRDGDLWFLDVGRRSIGFRSAAGRLVEHPVPGGAFPLRMQHCMGKLWLIANTPTSSGLFLVDDRLQPRWYAPGIPPHTGITGISCDVRDRLWLTTNDYRTLTPYVTVIDSRGTVKAFPIAARWVRDVAPDLAGGVWLSLLANEYSSELAYVSAAGVRQTYELPTSAFGPATVAIGPDGTMWLAFNAGNAPLSVARLTPHR